MESQWHVSRHFIGFQAQRVRWLPCAAPGPPDHLGRASADNLFAFGGWHQDSERNYLCVANLHTTLIGDGGAQVQEAETAVQAALQHPGTVTDLKLADLGTGEVLILMGSSTGGLSFLKLHTPREPGADVSAVEVVSGCSDDGASLAPWLPSLHDGHISSIDLCPSTQEVLTAGIDGRLFAFPVARDSAPKPFHCTGGASSFHAARWCSGTLRTFVTASTTGGLTCWDLRQGAEAIRQSPSSWAPGPWLSVEVHPSRQHLCVTGGEAGEIAVWDLRFSQRPVMHCPADPEQQADIWEVKFDASEPFAGTAGPPVIACSEAGAVTKMTPGEEGVLVREELYSECCAVNSFDVEPMVGRDILWVSEQECVGYLRRPMP